jgi:hypothetical protein
MNSIYQALVLVFLMLQADVALGRKHGKGYGYKRHKWNGGGRNYGRYGRHGVSHCHWCVFVEIVRHLILTSHIYHIQTGGGHKWKGHRALRGSSTTVDIVENDNVAIKTVNRGFAYCAWGCLCLFMKRGFTTCSTKVKLPWPISFMYMFKNYLIQYE